MREPVSESYAQSRIREKIERLPAKPRDGLARVSASLEAAGVAPAARLHLVSAIADLGRLADETRAGRVARASALRPEDRAFPPETFVD